MQVNHGTGCFFVPSNQKNIQKECTAIKKCGTIYYVRRD